MKNSYKRDNVSTLDQAIWDPPVGMTTQERMTQNRYMTAGGLLGAGLSIAQQVYSNIKNDPRGSNHSGVVTHDQSAHLDDYLKKTIQPAIGAGIGIVAGGIYANKRILDRRKEEGVIYEEEESIKRAREPHPLISIS